MSVQRINKLAIRYANAQLNGKNNRTIKRIKNRMDSAIAVGKIQQKNIDVEELHSVLQSVVATTKNILNRIFNKENRNMGVGNTIMLYVNKITQIRNLSSYSALSNLINSMNWLTTQVKYSIFIKSDEFLDRQLNRMEVLEHRLEEILNKWK